MVKDDFLEILNDFLSPRRAVNTVDLLKGRGGQLQQIDRAIGLDGTSVFIYGERGVGKTSLAQTSARLNHPPSSEPFILSCDEKSTATLLVSDLVGQLVGRTHLKPKGGSKVEGGLSVGFLNVKGQLGGAEQPTIPEPKTVNQAVQLLLEALEIWQKDQPEAHAIPVVVVDEFDRLASASDRSFFAELTKQIGDRRLPLRLVLCGIGTSLDELMKAHPSTYRYVTPVQLERLDLQARQEILLYAAEQLEVNFPSDYIFRIAAISDGFPFYVHLIGARVLWEYHERVKNYGMTTGTITKDDFDRGIEVAVQECEAYLRDMYERATQKYRPEYEWVLWAAAAHPDLKRPVSQIYKDYCHIVKQVKKDPLANPSKTLFHRRLNALKKDTHANVLVGATKGWYSFREPVLRGYCRLVARSKGIDVGSEYPVTARRDEIVKAAALKV